MLLQYSRLNFLQFLQCSWPRDELEKASPQLYAVLPKLSLTTDQHYIIIFKKWKSTSASSTRIPPSQNVLHCSSPSQKSFCQHDQAVQNWIFGSCSSWHCKGMLSFINQFLFFFQLWLHSKFFSSEICSIQLIHFLTAYFFSSLVFWWQIEHDKNYWALVGHGHHL